MYHNSLYTDEIQSSVYQEDSHVMDYITYLKDYYKTQFAHPGNDGKWPNIQIDRYIELSVAKDCQFSRENALRFSLSSIKKGIDELVSRKETIGISGIACLQANGAPHKGVLIIGAPGIGKTSLVRWLCLGWAQGKLLQHYDMVILLQLRDRYLIAAKSIGEIIDPDDPTNGMAIFQEMKRKRGERVLIVFDGYDEAPAELKESVVQRLLEGRTLPLATVLITSRPAATDKLARDIKFEQKLEVLGFTKSNILQYAKEYFLKEKKPEETRQFRLYLKMHPHIFAMVYNPLHCAIVTEAYSFNLAHGRPIHTMTDLYTNLTLSLLSRYSSVRYTSYDELSDSVADKFWRLAKLAYDCFSDSILFFSDVPEDLIELGFFQSFPRMYSHKDASSCHSFLHLTVQEYLTALHASKCNSTQNQITTIHSNYDSNTSLFLAGLTQSLSNDIFRMHKYLFGMYIVPLLFEIQSPDRINSVLSSSDRTLISSISPPFSSYSVGYVLAVTHCKWIVNMPFSITSDKIIVHCLCRGFEAGGGQCDPEQISELSVHLTTSNDYHCMLTLPQSFLENVVELTYFHDERPYVDLNNYLLCKMWKKMSRLKTVIMPSRYDWILLSKNDILSISIICSSLQNTKISMYARSSIFYTQLNKAAVCFFRVKSIVGRCFTTYYDHESFAGMHMLCSKLPLVLLLEDLNWFADMYSTALEDHAHNYWYNPYTQECLSVVNLTAHLTTITITSTLQCPQSTVALLYHILHHSLLPCTVTSLNLTQTSSTIVHHLLPALSHNHQLICWRITDCSLFLRIRYTLISPVDSIKKDISLSRSTTDSLSNSTSSYTSLTVKLTLYILIFVFFLILFHLL